MTPAPSHAKLVKMARYRSLKSLLFFTSYQHKKATGRDYIIRRHHDIMGASLERVYRGEITRLIITMPPRYGKTELAVKNFIAAGLAINPSAKFLHLSASKALALENSEGARDIVRSPAYQELFPEVQVKMDTDSKAKWYTTAGGGVYATGAAGQVTGFGAGQTVDDDTEEAGSYLSEIEQKEGFAGAIVVDDPVKPDDADSDIKRVRVNNRYISTIKNRLNSKKTPIIIIMQRLHELDLVGHVLSIEGNADDVDDKGNRGEWTVVNVPALYYDDAGQMQCLDPTKHTVEDLLAMENSVDGEVRIAFQRQYMQNPRSREGLMFPSVDLNYFDPKEINLDEVKEYSFTYIDPANKGGDDICVLPTKLVGNKIYVDDVIYNTNGIDDNTPRVIKLILDNKCQRVAMEVNFEVFTPWGKKLQAEVRSKHPTCTFILFRSRGNKHTRILAMHEYVKKYFVFRKDWQNCSPEYRKFMLILTAYRQVQEGKGQHDDAPDGCASAMEFYLGVFKHLWPVG